MRVSDSFRAFVLEQLTKCVGHLTRKPASTVIVCTLTLLAWSVAATPPASAQRSLATETFGPTLERIAPDLHARLVGLERAQGVLFGALVAGKGEVDEAVAYPTQTGFAWSAHWYELAALQPSRR